MLVGRVPIDKEDKITDIAGSGEGIGDTVVHPSQKVMAGYVSVEPLVHGMQLE